jgi:hypothetical protein
VQAITFDFPRLPPSSVFDRAWPPREARPRLIFQAGVQSNGATTELGFTHVRLSPLTADDLEAGHQLNDLDRARPLVVDTAARLWPFNVSEAIVTWNDWLPLLRLRTVSACSDEARLAAAPLACEVALLRAADITLAIDGVNVPPLRC